MRNGAEHHQQRPGMASGFGTADSGQASGFGTGKRIRDRQADSRQASGFATGKRIRDSGFATVSRQWIRTAVNGSGTASELEWPAAVLSPTESLRLPSPARTNRNQVERIHDVEQPLLILDDDVGSPDQHKLRMREGIPFRIRCSEDERPTVDQLLSNQVAVHALYIAQVGRPVKSRLRLKVICVAYLLL